MVFAAGECRNAERFLLKRSYRQLLLMPGGLSNVAARGRLEFKPQVVCSKEDHPKVDPWRALLGVRDSEIAFFAAHEQARQTARRRDFTLMWCHLPSFTK